MKKTNWLEFKISDLFITEYKSKKIQIPTGAYVHKDYLFEGKTPRITVTSQNNGIDGYYSSNDKNYRVFENFISVSFLGTIFYHPYKASIDMKVHCLKLKDKVLNFNISMFLISEIKKSIENASYGNQLSSTDLPHKKIMIPVNDEGKPDYVFMEECIKEREKLKRKEYIMYCEKALKISGGGCKKDSLSEIKWKDFLLLDLFTFYRGNQKNMNALPSGDELLISAKNIDNGLKGFYGAKSDKDIFIGNCITLNNDGDGGVGLAFFQPYKFLLDTHVYALYSKHDISKSVMLFICRAISKQRVCFNHGHSISQDRLAKMKVMLPVGENNKPNYMFMEEYVKGLMAEKYKSYLSYIKESC